MSNTTSFQGQPIRDYIFPIVEIAMDSVHRILGTGFFIGNHNYALTAAHVISVTPSTSGARLGILFPLHNGWAAYEIADHVAHDVEDVALLSIEPPLDSPARWNSIAERATATPHGAMDYMLWGYPDDVYYELPPDKPGARPSPRPDLVCSKGHVRRRLTGVPIPNVHGYRLIELSQIAGGGCSGSPIFEHRHGSIWRLAGVYLGERRSDPPPHVGYAVPIDAFGDWAPAMLGHTIVEEIATSDAISG